MFAGNDSSASGGTPKKVVHVADGARSNVVTIRGRRNSPPPQPPDGAPLGCRPAVFRFRREHELVYGRLLRYVRDTWKVPTAEAAEFLRTAVQQGRRAAA